MNPEASLKICQQQCGVGLVDMGQTDEKQLVEAAPPVNKTNNGAHSFGKIHSKT